MAGTVDPRLPARLRRLSFIADNERLVSGAWYTAAQRLTDDIRPTVMAPYRDTNEQSVPQPGTAFGPATQSLWDRLMESLVLPVIRKIIRVPWDGTMEAAPEEERRSFSVDPNITDYLNGARNRLSRFPDELYSRVQGAIALGLDQGSSVQEVAERIQELLTVTGNSTYRNRAITVARTETIGAVNAGAFAAARATAEIIGDPNPQKVWLATDDMRTRPTHRHADGQRVALGFPFYVGGFALQFPGDPTGPPQEVINCRCTLLSVTAGEELDWSDRQFRRNAEDVWAEFDRGE